MLFFHLLQMIGTVVFYVLIMTHISYHSDQYCNVFGSKNERVFNSSVGLENRTLGLF